MDYLALVNRTRRECGISASALTSFSSLSTEDTRVKEWVGEAWHDIQLHKRDWQWMRKSTTFTTTASQQSYTATQANAADMADWKRDSFRCYVTATGVADEQILPFMDYERFRDVYLFGASRTQTGRPVCYTIAPGTKNLMLWPTPDAAGYTVVGDYYREITDLVGTTDDPSSAGNDLDSRWHMLIVYFAMESYASYEAASEVMQRALTGKKRLLSKLEIDQLPIITDGPPLA